MLKSLLCLACCTGPAICAEITLKLSDTYRVGDKVAIEAKGHVEDLYRVTSGRQVLSDRHSAYDFAGGVEATIVEVDAQGQPTAATLVVIALTRTVDGTTSAVVSPTSRITVGRDAQGRSTYAIGDQPVDKGAQKILEKVFTVKNPGQPSDDEAFGPGHPVTVGDTWPVDAAQCAKALGGIAPTADLQIDGTFTLTALAAVGTTSCALVSGTMTIANAQVPLPPGLKVDKSEFIMRNTGAFPVAGGGHRLEETQSFAMSLHAAGSAAGKDAPLDLTSQSKYEVSRKLK